MPDLENAWHCKSAFLVGAIEPKKRTLKSVQLRILDPFPERFNNLT